MIAQIFRRDGTVQPFRDKSHCQRTGLSLDVAAVDFDCEVRNGWTL